MPASFPARLPTSLRLTDAFFDTGRDDPAVESGHEHARRRALGGVGALYLAAATFGLSRDAVSGFAVAVWPPTGIALAALILYGSGLWPAIAIGAFLVNWCVGVPVLVAAGMALGNTLEAVVGAAVLERVVGFRPSLARLQDVLGPTGRNLRSRGICSICLSEKG
jgi:integral membrane sensor domain MASE1